MAEPRPDANRWSKISSENLLALITATSISLLSIWRGWFDHFCMMLRQNEKYEFDEYVGTSFVLLAVAVVLLVRREWQLRTHIVLLSAREQSAFDTARRDHLTGLANRLALMERLDKVAGEGVILFLIDLDGFKAINDQHGHAAGDVVLATVSQRLQHLAEGIQDCFVVRLGGDEFGCLMPHVHKQEADNLKHRIVCALEAVISLPSVQARVGASVGSAASTGACHDPDELLRLADMAMYQDKARRTATARGSMRFVGPFDYGSTKLMATRAEL